MTRRLSPAGTAFIKSFEQLRLTAYLPTPNDVWSIGYGHTHGVQMGDTCTLEQADAWFLQDVAWAENAVDAHAPQGITQNAFDALVSLAFNIGATNFDASTLLKDLGAGQDAQAADEFLRWDRQRGQVLPGLERRREAERAMFDTPSPAAV